MNVIAYSPFQDGVSAEAPVGNGQGDCERRGAHTDETPQTVWGHGFLLSARRGFRIRMSLNQHDIAEIRLKRSITVTTARL